MITLLAPSKTMNISPTVRMLKPSRPLFIDQAITVAAAVTATNDIPMLMKVSPAIATSVVEMYKQWGKVTKPAYSLYRGDAYKGFYEDTLTDADLQWSQDHILIMSGLYGALRPLDDISQYRLEMKTKMQIGDAKNLSAYWGDMVTSYVDSHSNGVVCILSSKEYSHPVTGRSTSRIIIPIFADHKPNGAVGPVPIYSKMMRGVMARWIIDNRIDSPEGLLAFTKHGYVYDELLSTPDYPLFRRTVMTPLTF